MKTKISQPSAEPQPDLFDILGNLYDMDAYDQLKRLCGNVLRSTRADVYQKHLALSFKALAQLRTHQYSAAVRNAQAALALYPMCPWTRFVTLYAYEAHAIATNNEISAAAGLRLGNEILRDGHEHIATDPCTHSIPVSAKRALLNDSRFLLAHLYMHQQNDQMAANLLFQFIEVFPSTRSEFTKREAQEALQGLKATSQ